MAVAVQGGTVHTYMYVVVLDIVFVSVMFPYEPQREKIRSSGFPTRSDINRGLCSHKRRLDA